jgi:hypothetical protein
MWLWQRGRLIEQHSSLNDRVQLQADSKLPNNPLPDVKLEYKYAT